MISVIIPTLNRVELLGEALDSLADQTFREFEVIVINDGGCSLESLVDSWKRKLPLRVIELPKTSGVAKARNVGVQSANGSYIAFLDDDDIFLPNHLQTATDALRTSGADCVYLGALVSGSRLKSLPADRDNMHRKTYDFNERFLLVANYIHTGSVVTRNFSNTSVEFDETFTVCEDWDLWIALRWELGYDITYIDELTSVYHQVAADAGTVCQAQMVSPTPFSTARESIYAKWSTQDSLVRAYRDWFTVFESYRNSRISEGLAIPLDLFDRVLSRLYALFAQGQAVDVSCIPSFFED